MDPAIVAVVGGVAAAAVSLLGTVLARRAQGLARRTQVPAGSTKPSVLVTVGDPDHLTVDVQGIQDVSPHDVGLQVQEALEKAKPTEAGTT
jgi:hypothetical protein